MNAVLAELNEKSPKISLFQTIRLSLYYYAFKNPQRTLLLFLILVSTLFKNWFEYLIRVTFNKISIVGNSFTGIILRILIFKLFSVSLNFVVDFLFEKHLVPYGGVVSSLALRNMLYSNNYANHNIPGSTVEYYSFEGSKSLAKISRIILLNGFSKMTHLIFDLYIVCQKDKSSRKWVFVTFLIGTVALSALRAFMARQSMSRLKKANDMAYLREKQYAETMDMMPVVKSYRCEDRCISKYQTKSRYWSQLWLSYKYILFSTNLLYDILSKTFRIMIAIFFVISNPGCVYTDIFIILFITNEILKTGSNLFLLHKDIIESAAMTGYIVEKLAEHPETLEEKLPVDTFSDSIEVKGVTYRVKERIIFSDVYMVLKRGDKAALFGRNGIGKSSIFKVLMNFDEFTGSVLMDGTDIRSFLMTDYRNLITYVPQDTRLFDDTIYENLSFGNDRSFEEIIEECKKMEIHDKIMLLPNGYNTIVGEGGKNLNGGLRQKIFYTRAFLREAEIYLFDEPTNNLDEANTKFLLRYINDPKYAKKTFLVICHDMDIVREFPKIYKFDEQKIVLVKG